MHPHRSAPWQAICWWVISAMVTSMFMTCHSCVSGTSTGCQHQALAIHGSWAISPGNDGLAGSRHLLYFIPGPNDETHGLFGVLTRSRNPNLCHAAGWLAGSYGSQTKEFKQLGLLTGPGAIIKVMQKGGCGSCCPLNAPGIPFCICQGFFM